MAYLGGMVRWVPAPHSRDPPFPGPGIGVRVRVKVRVRVRVRRTPGMADRNRCDAALCWNHELFKNAIEVFWQEIASPAMFFDVINYVILMTFDAVSKWNCCYYSDCLCLYVSDKWPFVQVNCPCVGGIQLLEVDTWETKFPVYTC